MWVKQLHSRSRVDIRTFTLNSHFCIISLFIKTKHVHDYGTNVSCVNVLVDLITHISYILEKDGLWYTFFYINNYNSPHHKYHTFKNKRQTKRHIRNGHLRSNILHTLYRKNVTYYFNIPVSFDVNVKMKGWNVHLYPLYAVSRVLHIKRTNSSIFKCF